MATMARKVQPRVVTGEEVLRFIKEKGWVWKSELDQMLANAQDRNKILKMLEGESNIITYSDHIEYGKPVKTKKSELYELFRGELLTEKTDHVKVGKSYCVAVSAVGFAETLENRFIDPLLRMNVHVSLHIEPTSVHTLLSYLQKELQENEDEIHRLTKAGQEVHTYLKGRRNSLKRHIETLKSGEEIPLKVSIFAAAQENTLRDATAKIEQLITLMGAEQIIMKTATNYHREIYLCVAPLGVIFIQKNPTILMAKHLAHNFP